MRRPTGLWAVVELFLASLTGAGTAPASIVSMLSQPPLLSDQAGDGLGAIPLAVGSIYVELLVKSRCMVPANERLDSHESLRHFWQKRSSASLCDHSSVLQTTVAIKSQRQFLMPASS
jgi:hypothetical protein